MEPFVVAYTRGNDSAGQQLEFYLHVYFTIYPVHALNGPAPNFEAQAKEADAFKTYLDTQGAQLATLAEFLPFYALPYIKNPQVFSFTTHRNIHPLATTSRASGYKHCVHVSMNI